MSDSKQLKVMSNLFFAMALFATMPIITVRNISIFNLLFILMLLVLAFSFLSNARYSKVYVGGTPKRLYLWFMGGIISTIIGYSYYSFVDAGKWSASAISYLPKILLYFAFAIFIINNSNRKFYAKAIVSGLFWGAVINCVWSIIDGASYYILGISLNNTIFSSYAINNGIRYNMISLCIGGLIRASGFNYDPAHMGLMSPIVVCIGLRKKNYILIMIGLLSILTSASTTALAVTLIVVLIHAKKFLGGFTRKISMAQILAIVAVLVICVIGFIKYNQYLFSAIEKFSNRVTSTYVNGGEDNMRIIYLKYFPKAILNAGIGNIFGTGFGTSSFWYVKDSSILDHIGSGYYFPYDMEMTYIAYFFDLGIIGIGLLGSLVLKTSRYIKTRIDENPYLISYVLISVQAVSCLFYHYIFNAVQILTLISIVALEDSRRLELQA